ncbi:putative aquaporin-12A [Glandiceps talaboti]
MVMTTATWPACIGFVAATTLFSYTCRVLYRRLLPTKYHTYAAEVVSSFQLVAGVLEGDIILDTYGLTGYSIYLFCLFLSFSLTFDGTASVCTVWEDMLTGRINLLKGHVKIACQLLGGVFAPIFVKRYWKMAMSGSHLAKSELLHLPCQSALKVAVLPGMMAEMLATLLSTLVINFHIGGDRYGMYVESLVSVTIILIGLEWTGMMFNPILATALTYNCQNHPLTEHLMVYWLGPFLAVVLIWFTTGRSTVDSAKKTN